MLIDIRPSRTEPSLHQLLLAADRYDVTTSFGEDIDTAQRAVLNPNASHETRCEAFLSWASRHQPCLFGRLGAKSMKGIGIDVCWIDEEEIAFGDQYLTEKIQAARRTWKRHAAEGDSHGFLIVLSGLKLAFLRPGTKLLQICEKIANLYLVEHAPIDRDVVYTESMPLRHEGLKLFKAGVNIFYPSAHRTRNHDRRIPGGLMISVNSPGHWANSLVKRKLAGTLDDAVDQAMDLALRSIGNGGIGHKGSLSASWHNHEVCLNSKEMRRKAGKLPNYVPDDYSQRSYSALYHTDVLVPTDVTVDATVDPDRTASHVWSDLVLDYISSQERTPDHINYALFRGHPVAEEAVFHNPWPPRRAVNPSTQFTAAIPS